MHRRPFTQPTSGFMNGRHLAEMNALQTQVDALKLLQVETAANEILKSRKLKAEMKLAVLDRAWTHSHPARSGCALSLREMDSFTPAHSGLWAFVHYSGTNSFQRHPSASNRIACSQHARLKGEL